MLRKLGKEISWKVKIKNIKIYIKCIIFIKKIKLINVIITYLKLFLDHLNIIINNLLKVFFDFIKKIMTKKEIEI